MKIAITSTGPSLDSDVDPRFGRGQFFIIIDVDSENFDAVQNPNINAGGGAGIQSAQLMAQKGVAAVVTGSCGPNAFQVFSAAGIQVITGASGTVRQALQSYKSGQLTASSQPDVDAYNGITTPPQQGYHDARGMGMGRGGGRGMGMGRGMGRGMGWQATTPQTPPPYPPQQTAPNPANTQKVDVETLKKQAEQLEEQLAEIQKRIKELDK